MRRILVAIGVIMVLCGALMCWPLTRIFLTHEWGHARVLEIYRQPHGDDVTVRAVWEMQTGTGAWLIGDTQRSQFFRTMGDPQTSVREADEIESRVLPDNQGHQTFVKAFWKANDPAGTAFIIDVSETHPWIRYITGLALCALGLITARLAWASGRWRDA